jgi:hypothetical protein
MKPMLVPSSTSSLRTSMWSLIGLINETLTAVEPGLIYVFHFINHSRKYVESVETTSLLSLVQSTSLVHNRIKIYS